MCFPLKTRALAWRFTCVEIGPTGNGPRHREEQVITVLKDTQAGMGGLRALLQARHLRCHLLTKGGRMRRSGSVNRDKIDQSERTAV
jgi:hypothetical protein